MDLMNSRFRNLGFGSKRKSSSPNIVTVANSQTSQSPLTNGAVHTPTGSTSSTTSLPMNHGQQQTGLGRPPSYTYNNSAPRAQSPLPPGGQTATSHHPQLPPIATGNYPPGHPALSNSSNLPQYGGPYGQPNNVVHGGPRYGGRTDPVEVPGDARSKAQLIVGIDFVSIVLNLPSFCANFVLSRVLPFLA